MPGKKKGTEGLDKVEIVLVGEPRVGKTSLLRQLCRGTFSAAQQPTVGLDFERATLRVRRVAIDAIPGTEDEPDTHVVCWDVSGAAQYRELAAHYYAHKRFVGLVCDLTSAASLAALPAWRQRVLARDSDARFAVFATHADKPAERAVSREELDRFCGRDTPLFELAASDHDTVHDAFVEAFRVTDRSAVGSDGEEDEEDVSGALTASAARAKQAEQARKERRREQRREERDRHRTEAQRREAERRRLKRALPRGDAARVLPGEELHEALLPKLHHEDQQRSGCCCCTIC